MKRLHRPLRYLWYLIAGVIMLLAITVSLARALLPYLDEYRTALETEVSNYLGQPVTIERLDAHLIGISPSIIFRNVALKSADSRRELARFREIRIGFDPIASLHQRQLVFRELSVTGANIVLVRRRNGSFGVEGLVAVERAGSEGVIAEGSLGTWLLKQGRLAVHDSTLLWRDEQRRQQLRFAHVDMELHNSGFRHRLNAGVTLPEGTGKSLKIAVDIRGNPLLNNEWGGAVYLQAEALYPAKWLPLVSEHLPEIPLKEGAVSGEIWSDWQQGRLVGVEGEIDILDALLRTKGRPDTRVPRLATAGRWQSVADGWMVDLQHLRFDDDKRKQQGSTLHLEHRLSGELLLADTLQLDELARLALHLPLLPPQPVTWLHEMAPRGEVRQLRVEYSGDGRFASQGEFHALEVQPWQYIPGFSGASGRWRIDSHGGEISLDARDLRFDAPALFREPLAIDVLSTQMTLVPLDDGWLVSGRDISASNADIAVRGEFDMQFEAARKPYLDLRFGYWNGVAQQVPHYIPARIMGEGAVAWLDSAFVAGKARSGTLRYHGRSTDFPFADQSGLFETRFEAEDVELAFQPGWPHLYKVSGEVLFENAGMTISPRSGQLFSTDIEKAVVAIADLGEPLLTVDIGAAPPIGDVLRLLRETPLATHVGGTLDEMEAEGRSTLLLNLQIPLSDRVAERFPLAYRGDATLQDGRLQVWNGVVFRKLNGTVSFSESAFESRGLHGELFDAPVSVTIHTDENQRTVVSGEGRITAEALHREVQLPFIAALEGESDWRGHLYLPRGEGTHPSMEFSSTLNGMALNLPTPVGKGRDESAPLSVRLAFGEAAAKRLSLSYGERVVARLAFDGEPTRLRRAALRFGAGSVELPKVDGWRISGSLKGLDWGRWRELLPSGAGTAVGLPLVIDMDHLSLVQSGELAATGSDLTPEQFPSLDLHVRDLVYDQWHLGEVRGSSRSDSELWEIPELRMVAPDHEIRLSARWHYGEASRCELAVRSGNVEQMLKSFALETMIASGKGSIDGTLQWPGTLSDASWATLEGKLAVEIRDGALVDVKPGAGRLFGLLSLQALPRRLGLDFRDLFGKGMQFDEIKGDIRVKDGDATTSNLYLKSPSAGVLVEGRTGLVRRDYDQTISVMPNVSESVSIASAIAWGPQVAAAVLLFQNVFKKDIAEATMIRYSLSGSWDDPQIKRMTPPRAAKAE